MAEIIHNRAISPLTRGENSERYKVPFKNVGSNDVLVVNITHNAKPFSKTYRFAGKDLINRKSIHFSVSETGSQIEIKWSGVQPLN